MLRRQLDMFVGILIREFLKNNTNVFQNICDCEPAKIEYMLLLAMNYNIKNRLREHPYNIKNRRNQSEQRSTIDSNAEVQSKLPVLL